MRTLRAELSKLLSLPATWVAALAGVIVPTGVAILTASAARGDVNKGAGMLSADTGYQDLAFGVVGAIVLGVIAISSEYTTEGEESGGGRQITTSLTAVPSRRRFLAAKIMTVIVAAATLGLVASTATLTAVQTVLGSSAPTLETEDIGRVAGVVIYWTLTALLAFGLTILVRNGIAPMAVMIANTSVVSVTFLLARTTPPANYLPDMAGVRMFIRDLDTGLQLSPITGGLVMAAWVAALVTIGTVVFSRRDA